MDQPKPIFHSGYSERCQLRDGSRIRLGLVSPGDRKHLAEGFQQLSTESRQFRFLAPKQQLTEAELRYLTEVDGRDHFALGAVVIQPDGSEQGAGVARFVRLAGEPETAEPAIVVVDRWQNLGLGTLLLQRISQAAQERGIHRFRCEFLVRNQRIRELLESISPEVTFQHVEGGLMKAELPIPVRPEPETDVKRLLRRVADGSLRLLTWRSVLKSMGRGTE